MEALRECRPPCLKQINTVITPTLPTVSCEAATSQQCYYALHCLGGDRLSAKILDHYLHHNLFMLQLLWWFFCSFTYHKRQTSPPNFSQFFIIPPRTLPENFMHIMMSLMMSYNYMMTFSCHVTYVFTSYNICHLCHILNFSPSTTG